MSSRAIPPTQVAGRRLLRADGETFRWIGDTAWELAHRLTLDEVRTYAEVRADQGFTVVQFCAVAELDGLRVPNRQGDRPFAGLDPAQPDAGYFQHVVRCCDVLIEHGLVPCLLPTWGDKVHLLWGDGPEIFTPDNAAGYGSYLAEQIGQRPIVWMLGGDRPAPEARHRETWHAMAEGVGDAALRTFHPNGGLGSTEIIGTPDWLDFACIQSGHTVHAPPCDTRAGEILERELAAHDLPVVEAEPLYEAHPKFSPGWKNDHGTSTMEDVLSILKNQIARGACGVTYGCHAVWQMYDPARGTKPINRPLARWQDSLRLPAAEAVRSTVNGAFDAATT